MKRVVLKLPAALLIAALAMAAFPVPSYAASEKTLTYDYYFETDSPDDMSYPVDQEIEVEGRHYRLKDVEYKIFSEPVSEKRKVKSKDRKADEYITTQIGDQVVKLYAPEKIKWKDNTVEFSKEYKTEEEIPDETELEGKILVLKAKEPGSREEAVSTTAIFYAYSPDENEYMFNGKEVTLRGGQPKWNGWANDYADYLGVRNNNNYSIVDSKWSGKARKRSDGVYVRNATIYGRKTVNYWIATYGNADDDEKYSATITYTSKYIGHAAATYERYLTTKQKLVYAGIGLGILVLLTTLILFLLRRKKGDEEDEEDVIENALT